MRKLFQTLYKYKLSLFICAIIILLGSLVLHTTIALGNLVSLNGFGVTMLGTEMRFESGPDFKSATEGHMKILKEYIDYMDDVYLADILSVLFGEYSPKKGLRRALDTLENAKGSQEEFAKAIWLAGEQVEQYHMKTATFPSFKLDWYKNPKVPNTLLDDIKKELENSQKSLDDFKKKQTLENAVRSCEANRRTMLLVFLAWSFYNNDNSRLSEYIDAFQQIVKDAKESKLQRAAELPDGDPEKRFLIEIIAESEQRRSDILVLLKADSREQETNNREKICFLMWESIEKAYNLRPKILELSEKVGFGQEGK